MAELAGKATPSALVLMGVSGSGKTTIGVELARQLGETFADADDYHSAENKAKMAAGTPLTDEDRRPWLAALNALLRGWVTQGQRGVLACSALKAGYRDTLARDIDPEAIAFVWLDLSREVLQQRLAARKHSFMNPALLDSQIATLEKPKDVLRVMNDREPAVVAAEIRTKVFGSL